MKKKILVVNDEPNLLELTRAILELEDFEVTVANNPYLALSKMKLNKPDLVLLDMVLPKMSGLELCEKIRKDPNLKDLNIAMFYDLKDSQFDKTKIKDMQIRHYIPKPFDTDELVSKVKEVMNLDSEDI